jgi:hypothetical protein
MTEKGLKRNGEKQRASFKLSRAESTFIANEKNFASLRSGEF